MSKTEEMRPWMERLWRAANYDMQAEATRIYRRAILRGEVVTQPCVVCGSEYRVHGHHEDYAKPLEIVWLCPMHHTEAHRYRPYYERNMVRSREQVAG